MLQLEKRNGIMSLNEPDMIVEAIQFTIHELGPKGILMYLASECEDKEDKADTEKQKSYWAKNIEVIEKAIEELPDRKE